MDTFAKKIPSVFIVYTPFQVLCAVAAIRQLEIEDYKIVTRFPKGEVRNSQTKALFEKYHIKYKEAFLVTRFSLWYYRYCAFVHRHTRYKRLFIGDLRSPFDYYIGYNYVADYSKVVFLDDGNITINYLQDCISEPMELRHRAMLDRINLRRNLDAGHNFLTIYADIESPNNRLCQLDLHQVIDMNPEAQCHTKGVFIVGTNIGSFCQALEIPENVYIQKLGDLMQSLHQQYPDDKIFFIPHGRENKDYGMRLCEKYDCAFLRPQMMIELELLNMPCPPKAIYGYTSTALYTLKKLFPQTRVVNILFQSPEANPFYRGYVMCSEYYQKNGIELVRESFHCGTHQE